jgi:alpha-L-rhamnosidase
MKDVAGIRPDPEHPGYQSFLIEPLVTGDLTFAEGSTQSPYGQIKSRWEKKGDLLNLEVTVPPNSSATVHLPTSDVKSVTESGRPIGLDEGVTVLQAAGNLAVVRVESGHYLFAAKR